MSDKEKRMMDKFSKTIPKLEETDQVYVLGLVEGMALAKERESKEKQQDKTLINP